MFTKEDVQEMFGPDGGLKAFADVDTRNAVREVILSACKDNPPSDKEIELITNKVEESLTKYLKNKDPLEIGSIIVGIPICAEVDPSIHSILIDKSRNTVIFFMPKMVNKPVRVVFPDDDIPFTGSYEPTISSQALYKR